MLVVKLVGFALLGLAGILAVGSLFIVGYALVTMRQERRKAEELAEEDRQAKLDAGWEDIGEGEHEFLATPPPQPIVPETWAPGLPPEAADILAELAQSPLKVTDGESKVTTFTYKTVQRPKRSRKPAKPRKRRKARK